jgi:hypothetical protein
LAACRSRHHTGKLARCSRLRQPNGRAESAAPVVWVLPPKGFKICGRDEGRRRHPVRHAARPGDQRAAVALSIQAAF